MANTRSWLGLELTIGQAGLVGFEDIPLTFTAADVLVQINQASGTTNGTTGTPAKRLNWTTALVSGVMPQFSTSDGDGKDLTDVIELVAAGTVAMDLASFALAKGGFQIKKRSVDVDVDGLNGFVDPATDSTSPDLNDAAMMTVALTDVELFVGVGGTFDDNTLTDDISDDTINTDEAIGFKVSGANIILATVKASPVDVQAGDTRSYLALKTNIDFAGLVGLEDILTANGQDLVVEINQASGMKGTTLAAPLDWTSALDLDGDQIFGEDIEDTLVLADVIDDILDPDVQPNLPVDDIIDPGLELDPPVTDRSLAIDFSGPLLKASGYVELSISEFVTITGNFAFEKGANIFITEEGATTTTEVSVLKVGASDLKVFAGVGGPYFGDPNGDGKIDSNDDFDSNGDQKIDSADEFINPDAMGLVLTVDEFAMGLMKQVPPTGGSMTPLKSYTALKLRGGAEFVGIDAFEISAQDMNLEVNMASGPVGTKAIDFTKLSGGGLEIPTGSDSSTNLTYSGGVLRVAGFITIRIDSFVFISGAFAFEKGQDLTDVILSDGTTTIEKASLLKIGASNVNAFVGVGGPYFQDDSGPEGAPDGVIDELDSVLDEEAMGLAISDLEVALALFKELPQDPQNIPPNFVAHSAYALKASGSVEIVGIEGLTIAAENMVIEVNGGSQVDTSGDGKLDNLDGDALAVDFAANFPAELLKLDTNGDGLLNDSDLPTVITDADADMDGEVTLDELLAYYDAANGGNNNGILELSDNSALNTLNNSENLDTDGNGQLDMAPLGMGITTGPGTDGELGTSDDPIVYLDFVDPIIRARGQVTVTIDEFVHLSGEFAFEKGQEIEDVELTDGTTVDKVSTLKIGASGVNVFVGKGGPYFVDSDGDGDIDTDDEPESDGATGLVLSNVSFGMALFKEIPPTLPLPSGQKARSYTALKVGVDTSSVPGSGVELVGVPGLELAVDNLQVAVNTGTSGVTATPVAGAPPPPAIDFTKIDVDGNGFPDGFDTDGQPGDDTFGLEVPTGISSSLILDFDTRTIAASGSVDLAIDFDGETPNTDDFEPEIALSTFISFEQTTRANGTQIIKVAVSGLAFELGGDPAVDGDGIFELSGVNGLLVITDQGIGGRLTLDPPPITINDSSGDPVASFDADELEITVSTSTTAINEEFIVPHPMADGIDNDDDGEVDEADEEFFFINATNDTEDNNNDGQYDEPGEPEVLSLPAGPYIRVVAVGVDVEVTADGETFTLNGDFLFEQETIGADPDGTGQLKAPKLIKVAATDVSVSVPLLGVEFDSGQGAFIFYPTGIAGVMSINVTAGSGDVQVGGDVALRINNTNQIVNEVITLDGENIRLEFLTEAEKNIVQFAVLNAEVSFDPFFSLSGDFTVVSFTNETHYGARNVELFIGEGPVRLEDGTLNPDAVGLLVNNGTLGVVKTGTSTTTVDDDRNAIFAFGEATLLGLDGLDLSGTVAVRINNTGQAVDEIITLPTLPNAPDPETDGSDNDGDGIIDETGETNLNQIRVQFSSTAKVEVFEAGFDELGFVDENRLVTISAADVFSIAGAVRFTRQPNDQVEVDVPEAAVSIHMADNENGGTQEAFAIRGSMRFMIGGGQGFQMSDLRVTGYRILDTVDADIPTPASALRPLTARLANPFNGSVVDVGELNARGYIDVVFDDVNRSGFDGNNARDSITDTTAEFTVVSNSINDVVFDTVPTLVDDAPNDRTYRYNFTGQFAIPNNPTPTQKLVEITFLDNSWNDASGAVSTAGAERFHLTPTPQSPEDPLPPAPPTAILTSPFSGALVSKQSMNAKRFIDVTFLTPSGGTLSGIDGDEIKLSGTGTTNISLSTQGLNVGLLVGTPQRVTGNTYRYFVTPKTGTDVAETFVNGEVMVQFVAGSWSVTEPDNDVVSNAATTETFTVDSTLQDAGAATNAIAIGPLSLEGPSVGIAKLGFKEGKLVVTVGIGVDVAKLNFGGGSNTTGGNNNGGGGNNQTQQNTSQSNSGITAELNGVLGKFDIIVDVLGLISGGGEGPAFEVPGNFSLDIASLTVTVPDMLRVTGSGIQVKYDPNYDPEENDGKPQELVIVQTASITVIPFDLTGSIEPYTDPDTSVTLPGLVVREDGFALGEAQICYDGGAGTCPGTTGTTGTGANGTNAPAPTTGTRTTQSAIKIGNILELTDIRVGVQNLDITFGESFLFTGNVFVATGGAKLFPGKSFTATISDRTTPEATDMAPNFIDTEALRATLEFDEDGKVKGFQFDVDTLELKLGSVVTLNATDFMLDTAAEDDEEIVSFLSVGAEVRIGSTVISGEARNFAFLGDGTFVTKPGFGVFLGAGSATGDTFKWPKWLPIKINEVGIVWPDIQQDPSDFTLILSASVTGLHGLKGLEFSGAIEGIRIDVGKLLDGEFPVIGIDAIGVQVAGNLFGGEVNGALIGGILKLDAAGRMISPLDLITPAEDRIFFIGLQGGFEFPGVGGITIRFAMSELGPLGVFLNASVPGGILLEPTTGLSMNDFSAGV